MNNFDAKKPLDEVSYFADAVDRIVLGMVTANLCQTLAHYYGRVHIFRITEPKKKEKQNIYLVVADEQNHRPAHEARLSKLNWKRFQIPFKQRERD